MIYLKPPKSYLFAYDEKSGITFVFKNNEWNVATINYTELLKEEVLTLTTSEAMLLTSNKTPTNLIKKIENELTF